MDYQERKDIASKLRNPEDMLQVVQDFLNMGGDTSMKLYLEGKGRELKESSRYRTDRPLQEWHPTLQQCLMRGFIIPAIKALSEDDYPDARNIGTVKTCREILPIIEKHKLPFV